MLTLSRKQKKIFSFAAAALSAALLTLLIWLLYTERSHTIFASSIVTILILTLIAFYGVRRYDRIKRQTMYDWLTHTTSRRHFEELLRSEVAYAHIARRPLSLLILDLDGFKKYNDAFGHLAGDELLRDVAALLKANVHRDDLVARLGGDEFAILLPDTTKTNAFSVAQRLRDCVEAHSFKHRPLKQVSFSGGLAELQPGEDATGLLQRADAALFAAKRAGGYCTHVA